MTPPSPRSKLGDRVALKVIVEVNSSLATVTILETMGVVVPPGAMRVEKLPTRELIVPTWIVEALIVLTARALGRVKDDTASVEAVNPEVLIVEALILLIDRACGRVKDDTARVEAVNAEVLIVEVVSEEMVKACGRVKDDTLSVEAVIPEALIVDALMLLIVRAPGRAKDDTFSVEVLII
jgi:hypothetical protein